MRQIEWDVVAPAIKARRIRLSLSQVDAVAMDDSLSVSTLSKIERGAHQERFDSTVAALCRVLSWPFDALQRISDGEDWEMIETVDHQEGRVQPVGGDGDPLIAATLTLLSGMTREQRVAALRAVLDIQSTPPGSG